jgi:UDP-N-acetylmuramate dehydrogenase
MLVHENSSLKPYNTFGIDVKTLFLVELLTEEDVFLFLSDQGRFPKPFLLLGGGSNLLFTKDFQGTVIRICTKGVSITEENEKEVFVRAAAGENWDDFVRFTVEKGWGGLENLSLIPGNVGTSPVQNIGAYGVELKDTFDHLNAIHIATSKHTVFTNAICRFGYRESVFKEELKGEYLILDVTFRLFKDPLLKLDYGTIRQELQVMQILRPTIADVREAVCRIRRNKLPDPSELGNAGSFFKNPLISEEFFLELKKRFPEMVHFAQDENVKIAAAWLIEQCGWKGKRIGDAGVHQNQPLVLVNYGTATGKEILDLSSEIITSVELKFGIRLEPEVNVIG